MRNVRWLAGAGLLLLGVGLAVQGRLEAAALTPALAWYRTYNGPASGHEDAQHVVVDAEGNVYAAGRSHSGSNWDYLTVKYDPQGNMAPGWPQRLTGSGNSDDLPTDLEVDAEGNVYVTGQASGTGNWDYLTVKYDPQGNVASGWPQRYNGPAGGDDMAVALGVDGDGIVYVSGHSWNGSNNDYLTVKYDAQGNVASGWPQRYNSSANTDDRPVAMAVDTAGNVCVTGETLAGAGTHDYLTVKYDPAGNLVSGWPQQYDGGATLDDDPSAVAVAPNGSVYVTGRSWGVRQYDYVTVKYGADGTVAPGWPQRYNGPADERDQPQALLVCADGGVCVTGSSWTGNIPDFATVKYGPDGTVAAGWPQFYNGSGNADDQALSLAQDATGNIYVTGLSSNGSNRDSVTLRYAPDGTLAWSDAWENPASGGQDDIGRVLVLDPRGQLYVAGSTSTNSRDFLLLKYGVQYTPEAQSFSLTTDESAPAAAKLRVTDIDSPSLTYTIVDQPGHGSLSGTAPDLTYTPDDGYSGSDSFTYKASDGTNESNTATVSITVDPVGLPASLSLSPGTTVKGGDSLAGKVTLDAAAVGSGAVVALAASDPAASVPATVTVPAGQTEATFTITTTGVAADTPVTLTASRAGTDKTAELTVEAPALRALTLTPGRVVGGRDVRGRVFLDADAPAAGLTVSLGTAHAAASVPAEMTVAPGARWADFTVTTTAVTADTTADVEATWDGVTRKRALTVAPLLAGVTVTAPDRVGGSPRYAVVTLNGPAPTGGALLDLSSSDPALVPPAQVTVAAGRWSLRFLLASAPVAADTEVTLTASHAGRDVTGTGKVLAPGLLRLRGRTSSVGGRTVPLYVDLTGPAPAGGVAVSLQSDDAAASVPAQVTVPAGASTARVPVRLAKVSSSRTATVTATLGSVSKTLALTITP